MVALQSTTEMLIGLDLPVTKKFHFLSSMNLHKTTLTPMIFFLERFSPCDTGHLEQEPGVERAHHVPRARGACPHLRGSEAEGGGVCVRPLSVL